ncbi:MAG: N-acetylneuraminate synthase [Candidatus Omnitrophica bacterium]|nr:N-acetylneuraminate synthase [Candidatus Omnitrophota bacterium]
MLRDFDLSADALKKSFYVPGVLKKTTPAIVIAEAGVNHNGSLSLAKKLVEAAVEAGADIVKFQTFKADRLVHENTPKAEYQKKATGNTTQTQFQMLKKLELSFTMHRELIDVCRKKGIGFLSSPFDEESVDFLASLGVGALKIPSGEITHAPFLLRAARTGLPLILSTGMATLDEIEAALGVIAFGLVRKGGRGPSVTAFREAFMSREGQSLLKKKATLLHCVTQYPTPPDQMNLLAMDVLRERFGMRVGLSDHTSGIAVPVAAVARGAVVIEKHLTLNRRMSGPDHAASLEPKAFREMVLAIRQAERAMGDRVKAPVRCEIGNRFLVRKSLRAAWAIRRGETFNPKNMTAMRPDDGPSPMRYWDFLGKKANRDFAKGEILC